MREDPMETYPPMVPSRSDVEAVGAVVDLLDALRGVGVEDRADALHSLADRVRRSAARASRVVSDPAIMGGAPCIAGTRVPVATVVAVATGTLLEEYPQLTAEDVTAALLWEGDLLR
jgi:uncharacterized protein (DUF433 family)